MWTSFRAVTAEVCIVGAGLAGLSAAAHLQKNGIAFTLLEASNRLGGRVYPTEYQNSTIQLGAEFINGKDNEMYRIASRLKLISGKEDDYSIYENNPLVATGSAQFDPELMTAWSEFVDPLENEFYEQSNEHLAMTIGELFRSKYDVWIKDHAENKTVFDELAKTYVNYYESEWSADINKLALANFHHWDDGSEDESSFTMRGKGFGGVLKEIVKRVDQKKIRLNSEVSKIEWQTSPIRVSLSTNQVVECQTVILTVPLGVLKANSISILPELPQAKKRVINDLGFGRLEKLFLVYDKIWWDKDASHYITLNFGEEYKSFVSSIRGFESMDEQPKMLKVWISGSGPEQLSNLSENEIKKEITFFLRTQMNDSSIPEPTTIVIHKWLADKYTKGAYSYITPEAYTHFKDPYGEMMKPVKHQNKSVICFAGEHTHRTLYQTTSGAYESGLREANRVVNEFKEKKG
ncbi:unnamed protein product [Auanema sp. JU1783]|nr:unnamed protein product [Auanema sp. JU1783]